MAVAGASATRSDRAARVLVVEVADEPGGDLARRCETWAGDLGVGCHVVHVVDAPGAIRALEDAGDVLGIVFQPGRLADHEAVATAVRESSSRVVEVGTGPPRPSSAVGRACKYRVHGRGVEGYHWALRHCVEHAAWPVSTHHYGDDPEQHADLRLPTGAGPHPVVVLLHGGFWREPWTADTTESIAVDLARRGYATWNLEYRRVGLSGGGWPATLLDVAAGVDVLSEVATHVPLDLLRVVVAGHSAGGQLALWTAARHRLGDGPGGRPRVHPALALSLAGVCDLVTAARTGIGEHAVSDFLGGDPRDVPERYARASPAALRPLGVPQVLVHGTADDRVPYVQSRDYAAADADGEVEVLRLPGVDHFAVIESRSAAWRAVAGRLAELLPISGAGG